MTERGGHGERGRHRLTGDVGQAAGIALVAVAIFAGGLAVLVHVAQGWIGREERALPVAAVEHPTIGPQLPADESQAACVRRVIGPRDGVLTINGTAVRYSARKR